MDKVTVTMELTLEELKRLTEVLADQKPAEELKALAQAMTGQKSKKEAPAKKEEAKEEKVTKAMLRSIGVKISQAGKSDELKAVFNKYGADKLGDVDEKDYEAVYAELEEIDA